MHGSILILAKKKAAGPGGYFDPMAAAPAMAQGPMMFEMAQEDEGTDEQEMPKTLDMAKGSPSLDLREVIKSLKEAAMKLENLNVGEPTEVEAEEEEEDESEDEGESESEDEAPAMEAKAAPKPKAKKPFPGFLPKKVMKY
jgi:hypothetical protein